MDIEESHSRRTQPQVPVFACCCLLGCITGCPCNVGAYIGEPQALCHRFPLGYERCLFPHTFLMACRALRSSLLLHE